VTLKTTLVGYEHTGGTAREEKIIFGIKIKHYYEKKNIITPFVLLSNDKFAII